MKTVIVLLRSVFVRGSSPLLTAALLLLLCTPARGDEELRYLELYNGVESEMVSGTRSPRPASQTAENITVVTAGEIEALNAHTLADILAVVTGIQLEMTRTPGTTVNLEVQGSGFNHVLVLVDNVPINTLSENFADVSGIPAQMIERVEIVKGAASSAWGNALGGVVNVITKSPDAERPFGGMVSGSWGSRETADLRVEASGSLDRLGYYVSGGKLRSDGLLPNNMVDQENFYGKLTYDLATRGSLTFTTSFVGGSSGVYSFDPVTGNHEFTRVLATLSANLRLTERLQFDAAVTASDLDADLVQRGPDGFGNLISSNVIADESRAGGSVKLSWLDDLQRVVAGVDYEHAQAEVVNPQILGDILDRDADRVGVYLTDTLTLGRFAVTPSARFDSTGSGGDHFSPSFGITYALTDNSVLRGYTARGYSLTSLNRSSSTEKVWTSQLGFESGDLPYLWVKGTLFRNDTWDVIAQTPTGFVEQRQLKRGFELEARTLPFLNTSLSAGYTFIRGTEGKHGPVLKGIPRHTANVGLRYQDPHDFRAELTGNYVNWNESRFGGRYGETIWNLHLRKEIHYWDTVSLELFLSVRNLLNGDQYLTGIYQNPGRWAEAGVRCDF